MFCFCSILSFFMFYRKLYVLLLLKVFVLVLRNNKLFGFNDMIFPKARSKRPISYTFYNSNFYNYETHKTHINFGINITLAKLSNDISCRSLDISHNLHTGAFSLKRGFLAPPYTIYSWKHLKTFWKHFKNIWKHLLPVFQYKQSNVLQNVYKINF